jgi:dihydropteroate synthase
VASRAIICAVGRRVHFDEDTTHVMAVVNLSPESRIRESIVDGPAAALARAREFRDLGASIIDLGAQSSHFENRELRAGEELLRLLPTLDVLVADDFTVSVDTWKPEVAAACVDAGAAIVNDTGGLQSPAMVELLRTSGVLGVLMHIEGRNPLAVGDRALDDDRPRQVARLLRERVRDLRGQGVEEVVVDPGLSINYRSDYRRYGELQLATIRGLDELRSAGVPVLVPVPRKREDHRMHAYLTLSIEHGADIVRVHDVAAACDLVPLLGRRLGQG